MPENGEVQPQNPLYSVLQFDENTARVFIKLMDFVRKTGTLEQSTDAIVFIQSLERNRLAVEAAFNKAEDPNEDILE